MSIKVLTKLGAEITHIDDARAYNFDAGMRSGIVKGAFSEGKFYATGNVIALDPCELRIYGHRIVIDETWNYTFINAPTTTKKYSLIAQIQVTDNDVLFSLFVQDYATPLIQENLYVTESGKGTYQERIGVFNLNTDGNVIDLLRTIDVITANITDENNKGTQVYVNEQLVDELLFDSDPQIQINNLTTNYEEFTITSSSWTELADKSPFTYSATITASKTITNTTIVELINNQAVLFATYGFAIGDITEQMITLYALSQPTEDITVTIGFRGWKVWLL